MLQQYFCKMFVLPWQNIDKHLLLRSHYFGEICVTLVNLSHFCLESHQVEIHLAKLKVGLFYNICPVVKKGWWWVGKRAGMRDGGEGGTVSLPDPALPPHYTLLHLPPHYTLPYCHHTIHYYTATILYTTILQIHHKLPNCHNTIHYYTVTTPYTTTLAPHYKLVVKSEILIILITIGHWLAQMKRLDTLNPTQETLACFNVLFCKTN